MKTNQTTGANLSALDSKIGKLDDDGNYIKKDDSISKNLSTLDAQVKTNADNIANNTKSIQNITNSVKNLSDNAVQYDKDSNKTKVTLGGEGGTTITNVKDGALSEKSSDAVNGKQLYNEQKVREAADKDITEKVTNNTNEITKIKNGDFTDASKTAIHNIAKDAVKVVDGKNTTVTKVDGTDTTPTTYAVNVEGTGKVASGDTGLISGDTLYKEVHVDKDGSYIKGSQTVGQNLSALDSGLKTTSDLIHTNAKGDTIQIGGNSTATKIDVSGKDKDGNTTGRVITGVMTDGKDLTSAANVGYVNGITSANTQQIYRDMNNAYSRLDTNINRAAAGSNASISTRLIKQASLSVMVITVTPMQPLSVPSISRMPIPWSTWAFLLAMATRASMPVSPSRLAKAPHTTASARLKWHRQSMIRLKKSRLLKRTMQPRINESMPWKKKTRK